MNRKEPVHIRRNVGDMGDPYAEDEQFQDNTVCRDCGGIYSAGRWYPKEQTGGKRVQNEQTRQVTCPGCRKQRDNVPGGVIKITGRFFRDHQEEVMNLIRNETDRAHSSNPLERIMSMESFGDEVEITTTNEKLAQKIGKALHKAYSGAIEYKWSEDTKLARVNWYRE